VAAVVAMAAAVDRAAASRAGKHQAVTRQGGTPTLAEDRQVLVPLQDLGAPPFAFVAQPARRQALRRKLPLRSAFGVSVPREIARGFEHCNKGSPHVDERRPRADAACQVPCVNVAGPTSRAARSERMVGTLTSLPAVPDAANRGAA